MFPATLTTELVTSLGLEIEISIPMIPIRRDIAFGRLFWITFFVSLSIHWTGLASGDRCSNIFDRSSDSYFSDDPFVSFDRVEDEIAHLTSLISSRFGTDIEKNRELELLLDRMNEESSALLQLQERILVDEPIPLVEFRDFRLRLMEVDQELHQFDARVRPNKSRITRRQLRSWPTANPVILSKKAEKEIAALQPHQRLKYEEFISEVRLVSGLQELGAKWSLEKINMHEIMRGSSFYTIRINQGYRVLFQFDKDTGVRILRISKSLTHNN